MKFNLVALSVLMAMGAAVGVHQFVRGSANSASSSVTVTAPHQTAPAVASHDHSHDEDLRQQIEELRLQVAGINGRLAQNVQSQGTASMQSPAAPNPGMDTPDGQQARLQQERSHLEYMEQVDASFQRETIDRNWSDRTTAAVRAAFDAGIRGGAVRSIDCRSATCRVEIAGENTGDLDQSLPPLALQLGELLPKMSAQRAGADTILYLRSKVVLQ